MVGINIKVLRKNTKFFSDFVIYIHNEITKDFKTLLEYNI